MARMTPGETGEERYERWQTCEALLGHLRAVVATESGDAPHTIRDARTADLLDDARDAWNYASRVVAYQIRHANTPLQKNRRC